LRPLPRRTRSWPLPSSKSASSRGDPLSPAQATGVEQAQEGGVAPAPGRGVLAVPALLGGPSAGLEEAP
jgi:hypothetical protein